MQRRPYGSEIQAAPGSPFASPNKHSKKKRGAFSLNVTAMNDAQPDAQEEEKKEMPVLIEPKTRASGGVWVQASDIPSSFQSFIVYHNISKMTNQQNVSDKWTDASQPYIVNEKDIVIKLELDEELLKQQVNEYNTANPNGESNQNLPGRVDVKPPNFDQVLIAFAPNPTNKPHNVLPRYLMNV